MSRLSVRDLRDSIHSGPLGDGHIGFDVILGMDWLTAHRVVIDCDSRRIIAYTYGDIRVNFQVEKHAPDRAQLQVEWTVDGLASKPYPRG